MEWDVAWLHRVVIATTVCLPRLLACFMVLPIVGPMLVPRLVRNTLAVSFIPLLYPMVVTQIPDKVTPFLLALALLKEAALGFIIGYVAAIFFWSFQGMGVLIDNQRGAGQSQEMEGMASTESSPLGNLFFQFVAVLFLSSGGFSLFMVSMLKSYQVWPVFQLNFRLEKNMVYYVIQLTNQLLEAIVLLSAPVLISMFMVTLMMGLINRFAPKLNVFVLSMPIKSIVAILILIFYIQDLGIMFDQYLVHFRQIFTQLEDVLP